MTKLRVLDLFSGIGGFALGLDRTGGFETAAFCELDSFCRGVLASHWPNVKQYEDIRELTAERLAADGIGPVDVICGGFPCQDISSAGRKVGIQGQRSGLWSEYARLIRELRPRFVVVENVSALRTRGLDRVLGDLVALGYDSEWHSIPASAVGAPHQRDRVWILGYPVGSSPDPHPAEGSPWHPIGQSGWWAVEPAVDRVADGVPGRVDRLRSLGNSVVPQIPELIGRVILSMAR